MRRNLFVLVGILGPRDCDRRPPFLARRAGCGLRRRGRGARRARVGDLDRDRVGRRAVRACGHGGAAVDARQPARALHRALRALGRRARRRADVDHRLAVRERSARPRPRDHRRRSRGARRRDALPQPRLPQDTATLLLLAIAIIVLLGLSHQVGDRASRHEVAISVDRRGRAARRLRDLARRATCAPTRPPRRRTRSRAADAAVRASRSSCSRSSGVAAALVSDWFVAALDPAVKALGISKAFTGLVIVAIAGNAVENVVGITLAREGQVRPRRLGRQELGRADRRVPLPCARAAARSRSTRT